MSGITGLIGDLDWSKPEEVQKAAIKKLLEIDDLNLVLLAQQSDVCHKSCWYNAAKILKTIGYPRINSVLPYLMEWFQDINWPGVDTIAEALRTISPIELIPYIEEASKHAIAHNDDSWAFGLVTLIKKFNLTHLLNKELYNELIQLSDY
ncbi:DUF5071 domain-containing protein [Desulfitobacterium sp. Sab5]|uniref:DUF5071 domain-containing protein n=1 Tax=Desulfitobacterium nosdiversum TaxID=3375356 RepID=UPI003CE7D7A5